MCAREKEKPAAQLDSKVHRERELNAPRAPASWYERDGYIGRCKRAGEGPWSSEAGIGLRVRARRPNDVRARTSYLPAIL